jgi:acyl-CoA synthetase (AMP-forming)/AMP-acid ligase II
MNIAQYLSHNARVHSQKPALVFRDAAVSFPQLYARATRVAAGFSSRGLAKGDKIAIFLPNIPAYIESFLGAFILRAVCVPLDFMLTEEEVVTLLNHSEATMLVVHTKKNMDLSRIRARCPGIRTMIVLDEGLAAPPDSRSVRWQEMLDAAREDFIPPDAVDRETAAIFYTSGSTGHPKGVMLTYGHLDNPVESFDYFLHPHAQDILLCGGVPFSHIGGLDYILLMVRFGTTLVLMERFQPLEFLKNIEKYRVTIFCIVPSMYVAILSLKEYDKCDLSSLRYAVVFGAPSSPVLLERFLKVCPNAYLLNGWGMTETAAPNCYLPTGTSAREIPHTGKFPPGTEARIADETGAPLGDEVDGELWIKGSCVMAGYFKEPELTRQVLTPDGWLKTGDIARRDRLGRYSIVGRKKEMLKVAGEIVFCPEVEEAIYRHPGVKEAAVIGIPDALRGEVPKAFVAVKEGERLAEDELRQFLRQHLAHFKVPHQYQFVTELPKNRVGKIDKEKLKRL